MLHTACMRVPRRTDVVKKTALVAHNIKEHGGTAGYSQLMEDVHNKQTKIFSNAPPKNGGTLRGDKLAYCAKGAGEGGRSGMLGLAQTAQKKQTRQNRG